MPSSSAPQRTIPSFLTGQMSRCLAELAPRFPSRLSSHRYKWSPCFRVCFRHFPLLSISTWLPPLLIGHLMIKADGRPRHQSQTRLHGSDLPTSRLSRCAHGGEPLDNPYKAAFRPTRLSGRRFVAHISSIFSPPSCSETPRIKSLTVVLTMQIPHVKRGYVEEAHK